MNPGFTRRSRSREVINLKNIFGVVLILLGLAVVVAMLSEIRAVYREPSQVDRFKTVFTAQEDAVYEVKATFSGEVFTFEVSPHLMNFFPPVVLVLVLVAVINLLIRSGCALLRGSDNQQLKALERIETLLKAQGSQTKVQSPEKSEKPT
jgi:uncharacterized membrane protein